MAINVDVPEMGESITEAVLLEWLKGNGDQVTDEESICLLETDKANAELPAPRAGVLRALRHEGETIRVGETIARIETSSAETLRANLGCEPQRRRHHQRARRLRRCPLCRQTTRRPPYTQKDSVQPCASPSPNTRSIPPLSAVPAVAGG